MKWKTIDTAPEGIAILACWIAEFPGEKDVISVATRHGRFWHDPEDDEDEDDFREPQFWMPHSPSLPSNNPASC